MNIYTDWQQTGGVEDVRWTGICPYKLLVCMDYLFLVCIDSVLWAYFYISYIDKILGKQQNW